MLRISWHLVLWLNGSFRLFVDRSQVIKYITFTLFYFLSFRSHALQMMILSICAKGRRFGLSFCVHIIIIGVYMRAASIDTACAKLQELERNKSFKFTIHSWASLTDGIMLRRFTAWTHHYHGMVHDEWKWHWNDLHIISRAVEPRSKVILFSSLHLK